MVGGVLNALETSSKEQKREENNGSYFYLLVRFSRVGHILYLPLLISFFHRWTWLSFSNSASLCCSAFLCACISNLSVNSVGFTFQPVPLLPASTERGCPTVDLGMFNVGAWGPQAHSTATWHSACGDIPLRWEQLCVAGSGPGGGTRPELTELVCQ